LREGREESNSGFEFCKVLILRRGKNVASGGKSLFRTGLLNGKISAMR